MTYDQFMRASNPPFLLLISVPPSPQTKFLIKHLLILALSWVLISMVGLSSFKYIHAEAISLCALMRHICHFSQTARHIRFKNFWAWRTIGTYVYSLNFPNCTFIFGNTAIVVASQFCSALFQFHVLKFRGVV